MSIKPQKTNDRSHREFLRWRNRIEKFTRPFNNYCVSPFFVSIPDLLIKYSKKPHITDAIQSIMNFTNHMERKGYISYRSCFLFNELIENSKIKPKNAFQYALACLFYVLTKVKYEITMIEFLNFHYDDDINKDIIICFKGTQSKIIKELELEKIIERPCNYFRYLSNKFEISQLYEEDFKELHECIVKSAICKFKMNRVVFGSIFYHLCRQNEINISQKKICDSLFISRNALSKCFKEFNQFLKNNPMW